MHPFKQFGATDKAKQTGYVCIIEKKTTGWRILFLGGTRICQGFVIFYQVAGDMNMDVCRRRG